MRRLAAGLAAAFAMAAVLVGCQEKLTAPGACPEFCPGGQLQVIDTVLDAVPGLDSSFVGYLNAGAGEALLASTGLPGSEDRAIVRFVARPDSILISSVWYHYDVDSVTIAFNVRGRDTLVDNVRAVLYRLPRTIDSTATFASIEPELVDANLVDTVPISNDSVNFTVRTVLRGADLASVAIPAGDSGKLAIGIRIVAPQPTGIRFGTAALSVAPTFTTYATLPTVPDTVFRHQTLVEGTAFHSYVSQGTPVFDPDRLPVGGEPSARAVLRFSFPAKLRDSVSIVRATLELVPASPLYGLANDPTLLEVRPLLADLGAKSPLCNPLGGQCGGTLLNGSTLAELPNGGTDTVHIEVPRIVRAWQGTNPVPSALFLIIRPEAATFMRPVFYSTRSGVGAPRLRISYVPLPTAESP